MPIAFDSPTHAPRGTLPTRGARSVEDDAASLDIFTQLLLAAASVQDAEAPPDAAARAAKDDAAATDPAVLCLPLPAPLQAGQLPAANTVTIVAAEKIGQARGAGTPDGALVDALRAARASGTGAATAAQPDASAASPGAALQLPGGATSTRGVAPGPTQAPASAGPGTPGSATPQAEETPDPSPARPSAAPLAAAAALAALVTPALAADKPVTARSGSDAVPAAALQAAAPTPQAPLPVHIETVSAPAFTPGWQDETVNKLAQIVLTKNERAELKLNPAELGPVNVRVELKADQVSVQIVAASPETRSALEQSLPQLRDLLASQGITLGQASVQDGAPQRDARADAWTSGRTDGEPSTSGASRADTVHLVARRPDRLVDVFA